ncbi:MAG: arginine--tRNA ligase [Raineya sp.]|nr:arginine--tRNA ligase [Raineya sp.]MDW8295877.1 arginine--tRNA ligase [Raineya sp.]
MNIHTTLTNSIQQAFQEIFGKKIENITLQATKKEFEGTHTFVVFPFTKELGEKPAEIAQKIGNFLVEKCPIVEKYNAVQGFLNISLKSSAWLSVIEQLAEKKHFTLPEKNLKVVVEYSSPNTNKPLHLGHLRNIFLGFAISRIFSACGYRVHKTQIINDRGIHICKSMLAYELLGNNETPESSGLKGDHLIGKYYVLFDKLYKEQVQQLVAQGVNQEEAEKKAEVIQKAQEMLVKWENGDKEVVSLWKKLNAWVYEGFNATYAKLGVDFDSVYYESDTYLLGKDIVREGLEKGIFYQKPDGSVWIDLTAEGLDQKLVLRADGTSVYITQDLGTADLRYKDHQMDKMIYVVGNEQDYHFKVLFAILKKLGRTYAEGLYHLSYGMVELPTGKMKSREGTVVDADDLIEEVINLAKTKTLEKMQLAGTENTFSEVEKEKLFEMIGLGALKYFLLKIDPHKKMLYNPEESVSFEGDAAPFIQYTHARICSVLRKAQENKIETSWKNYTYLHPLEISLVYQLSEYTTALQTAAEKYAPYILAQYIYELCKIFSTFYAELSILKAENSAAMNFRLLLCELTAETIREGMYLLGIEVPERM